MSALSASSGAMTKSSPPAVLELRGAASELMRCRAREVLLQGPAGTGKTLAALLKLVRLCEAVPGLRALLCRATRVSLTESALVTLEREFLTDAHPARKASDATRANRHSYEFPNKSEIICGGMDNPDRIMSTEYDVVLVVEATEITEEAWEKLLTRLRNNRCPFQQAIAECNPGAPGHWLNRRATEGRMVRLVSRHDDNPSLTPEYLDSLSRLTAHRKKRLYYGQWAAPQGTVFEEDFLPEFNVVDDFDPPGDWPWYLGWDPGFDHPTAIGFLTVSPTGDIFVADEIYSGGFSVREHVEGVPDKSHVGVLQKLRHRTLRKAFGDPHEFFSARAQGKSCAVQAKAAGLTIPFHHWANQDKVAMVNQHRELLINAHHGRHPALYVMRKCVKTIMEYESWMNKRNKDGSLPPGEDRYEDENDHMMDVITGMVCTSALKYS